MNEDHGRTGKTLPFARPAHVGRRGGETRELTAEEQDAMLEIIKQQPEVNISQMILLHGRVESGRYQVNASRVAGKMLEFEHRLQQGQDNGGRNSSSSGKSSTSSTSHKGSSD